MISKIYTLVRRNILMEKPLVVFGDSSAEIFDYIFGKNKDYYPFWASGWSARSLNQIKHSDVDIKPYASILESLPKDSIILLHFGMTDVEFGLPILARDTGFYNLPLFLKEMIDGIIAFQTFLQKNYGFENIYPVFTSPPIWLPNSHWENVFKFKPFPLKIRGQMLLDFANEVSKLTASINCLDKLIVSHKNPICSPDYTRARVSHHIDFIEAQDLVYSALSELDGMLPQRNPKHTAHYIHNNVGVDTVRKDQQPRVNTCR